MKQIQRGKIPEGFDQVVSQGVNYITFGKFQTVKERKQEYLSSYTLSGSLVSDLFLLISTIMMTYFFLRYLIFGVINRFATIVGETLPLWFNDLQLMIYALFVFISGFVLYFYMLYYADCKKELEDLERRKYESIICLETYKIQR